MNNIHDINTEFKLPITYLTESKLFKVSSNLQTDLELKTSYDNSNNCIYDHIFNATNPFSKQIIQSWSDHYTTDTTFLKQSQQLYKELNITQRHDNSNINGLIEMWNELKTDTNFKERYSYVEWEMLEQLNHSSNFLSGLTIATLLSPVISLTLPILFMIIPFLILKFQNVSITFTQYFEVFKNLISKLPIGRMFQFNSMPLDQKLYSIVSCVFYVFQIYQNIMHCVKYHNNLRRMHAYIETLRTYNDVTIHSMNEFLSNTSCLSSYDEFNTLLRNRKAVLEDMNNELHKVTPYSFGFSKVLNIGHSLRYFYEIHQNELYHETLMYSFGFNGYIDNILAIHALIHTRAINKCKYTKKHNEFTGAYFAPLMHSSPVKNTYDMKKNIIITGPNAAGKTTILKTTLFNIILSQQIGYGFYTSAKINPYDYIHCYINIPDTSGRDSLFQAEARRCKDILDCIDQNKHKRHFCVFDELYSGTNPYEAIASAYAYLHFLNGNSNINYVLTTHYIDLCLRMKRHDSDKSDNYHMKIEHDKSRDFVYTYKVCKGISEIKGGIKVLKELNYPNEIIRLTESIIHTSLSI